MMTMVIRNVYFRPIRSPIAPNGRTMKPAAKASNAKTLRVAYGKSVKNCAPMIAASEP